MQPPTLPLSIIIAIMSQPVDEEDLIDSMRETGFRFDKDYRLEVTPWHRYVYSRISTVIANTMADGRAPAGATCVWDEMGDSEPGDSYAEREND